MKTLNLAMVAAFLLGSVAYAGTITYVTVLSGASEVPPNASTGTGSAVVTVDTVLNMMDVSVQFQDLLAPDTASHIHCCTAVPLTGNAGVATVTPTFTGFPSGVTSGSYEHLFDLTLASTYNPAFVTAEGGVSNAEAALLAGLASGEAYLNIHTTLVPAGEIRGFLTATPEPATFLMAGAALAGLVLRRRSGSRSQQRQV